jgi:hypothetical protein
MRTSNKCANDWVIQAYIDGELSTDEIFELENHLKICSSCSQRLADRRNRLANVLAFIEELENNPISNRKHKNVPLARVFAAAASIAIVFGFFTVLHQQKTEKNTETQVKCEWVELDSPNFQPEFESPNKLYQMRAIAIAEVDSEGNVEKKLLVKQCTSN